MESRAESKQDLGVLGRRGDYISPKLFLQFMLIKKNKNFGLFRAIPGYSELFRVLLDPGFKELLLLKPWIDKKICKTIFLMQGFFPPPQAGYYFHLPPFFQINKPNDYVDTALEFTQNGISF